MPLPLSDPATGAQDVRTRLFATQLSVIAGALEGTDVVLSGCNVTPSTGLGLSVALGAVLNGGSLTAVPAGTISVGAADVNFTRIDLVVWTLAGALAVRAGTPAVNPVPPARTANDVVLAMVFVAAGQTTLAATDVLDHRPLKQWGPVTLFRQSLRTTVVNSAAIANMANLTIPRGLLVTGRQLRVQAGGNYISNSGTPTWTWTISIGGTVIWADTTAATVASANRGAWFVDFTISAVSNTTQSLVGMLCFQTPGAKTAPTAGTAGDLAVVTHVVTPLRAAPAVDFSAANVGVALRVTMSVANAAVDTVCDFSHFELIY